MRCPKCRFVSFDYLDQCKKCGTDLSAERERLNLFNFEPSIPHFFGVLDDADQGLDGLFEPTAATDDIEISLDDDSGASGPDKSAELEGDEVIMLDEPLETAQEAEPAIIELSADDEVPELILDDDQETEGLELRLVDEDEAPSKETSAATASPEESPIEYVLDDEDLELELSPEEMERIILELSDEGGAATDADPPLTGKRRTDSGENS
jgi:hypothetical protein